MNILDTISPVARKEDSNFYNKVLSLFGLSILSTGLGVFLGFRYIMPIFEGMPILAYAMFALELILIITSGYWRKKVPLNYFLFSAFTFSSGVTIVPLILTFATEFGGFDIIYRALFATTVMFIAMGLLGWSIQKPLLGIQGFLLAGLVGLIVVGVMGIFLPWGNTMEMVFSGIGVLLFSLYAMVDINRLKYFPEDEYMLAAIQLYLDIFNLFIFILRLMGALSRD